MQRKYLFVVPLAGTLVTGSESRKTGACNKLQLMALQVTVLDEYVSWFHTAFHIQSWQDDSL